MTEGRRLVAYGTIKAGVLRFDWPEGWTQGDTIAVIAPTQGETISAIAFTDRAGNETHSTLATPIADGNSVETVEITTLEAK